MSTDQAATPEIPPELADAEEPKEWLNEQLEEYGQLLIGRAGVALDRVQKNSALAYAMTEAAATGNAQPVVDALKAMREEDMGVSVGNKTYNYNYAPQTTSSESSTQAAATNATSTVSTVAEKAATGLSAAAKGAIVAAVLGSGGLGAGGVALLNWLNTPAVTAPANDTDTNAAIELGE